MSFQQQAPASSGSTTAATEDRSTSFTAKDGGSEGVPGGSLMVAAYAIVWLVVLLLVVRVFQRQNTIARQIADLEEDLQKRGARSGE